MRRRLALVVGWCLILAACGAGDPAATTPPSPGSSPTTTTTSLPGASSTTATTTSSTTTSSTTTSSIATTTTIASENAGPDYVVAGAAGVFRVQQGVATQVVAAPDVMWAADDGMGGILYYAVPGETVHLRAGAKTPVTVADNATPRFVTLVSGVPTLEISQLQQGECDDADNHHAKLVDLTTGQSQMLIPCIPVESWGFHPRSLAGELMVTVAGGGWPEEEPFWSRIVFRSIDLPEAITSLTDWDADAFALFAAIEVDVAANPMPAPCHWCAADVRLSGDGTVLALLQFVPVPADLGAADWEEFDALPLDEQWRRWEELRSGAAITIRTINLETGEDLYQGTVPGGASLLDFDGRYLVYQVWAGEYDYPANTHLLDTESGAEIPINWGTADPGPSGHISLALPKP